MLLKEIKSIFHKELDTIYSKDEVDSFFHLLIEELLGLERFVLAVQPQHVVSKEEEQPIFEALSQLRLQRPIQYILGKSEFMGLDLMVNQSVLIPRPETEDLVRWILEVVQSTKYEVQSESNKNNQIRILDIGTGSGCITVSLAKNLPDAKIYGLDVSELALAVAQKNAIQNGVTVSLIHADILTLKSLDQSFDIIVSNPPYVREQEKAEMHNNVLNHEPELALFVSDEKPLVFYEAIAAFAKKNLKPRGKLFLEINQYLGKETEQLLTDHNFSEIELRKDIFGNERMLKATQR